MKKKTIMLSVSLLMAFSALAENHFINSTVLPYVRIDSGWAQFQEVDGLNNVNNNNKLASKVNNISGAGIGLGINFGDKVRSDLTWSRHLEPELSSRNVHTTIKRKPLIDAYFLNLYYETGLQISIFNPYVGVGAGVANVKDKLSYYTNNNGLNSDFYLINRKNNFAYKLMIGSAFDLNEQIKFDLSYNYSDYGKSKGKLIAGNQVGKSHYRAHIINAGLRFGL